jgi:hypothetical protein
MTRKTRRRLKQTTSLTERLHEFADHARDEAALLPKGEARNALLEKVAVTERALQLQAWLNSPGLRPPD